MIKAMKFFDYMMKSAAWVGFTLAMGWATLFRLCDVGTIWFLLTALGGLAATFYYRHKLKVKK